jgi:hypothetical protein
MFPQEIQDFANKFAELQEKRHRADYDPHGIFQPSEVLADIAITEVIIDEFEKLPLEHRRAFAAYAMSRSRKSKQLAQQAP